ncbi:DUF481 domain-containing protein [Psychroserpens sp. XS_ASV72]|uniref:DUF481 domain-containing protein n=2 Tax=Bacteroidota TaxID=976 RepID=A0A5R8LRK9_9FLAO|nr:MULTISPECIES: DUF481 domain-containing protein [Bacteroidota]MDN3204312.1 DUF481 domain-containing protein [Algoriphagus sediminis]TLF39867.1 DUF481 domain-containing protein [Maribacter aurantiacus]
MNKLFTLFLLIFVIHYTSFSQNDSLVLNNGDFIVGDLKSMFKGVLTIEPSYSDSDFKIKWKDVKELKATQRYFIALSDGLRTNGTLKSSGIGKLIIHKGEGDYLTVNQSDVVYIKSIDSGFLSRLSANIDFGFTLTKANNQQQLNGNLRMGYLADKWTTRLFYNTLLTKQDDASDIRRNDAGIEFLYILPEDWVLGASVNLLSNTEQSLDLRLTSKMGIGNYLKYSNTMYWNVLAGFAYNTESFLPILNPEQGITTTTPNRKSFEGFLKTELNIYDLGDLELFTNIILYPTIFSDTNVKSGRTRVDFRFDVKYDDLFIEDFYIRAGYNLNYDNRPAEAGKALDYIFTTGFGWEW